MIWKNNLILSVGKDRDGSYIIIFQDINYNLRIGLEKLMGTKTIGTY